MTIRPMVNRDSAFFWSGTAAGELRIQVCNACGAKRFPPGPSCPDCGAFDRGHEVASGLGTVFSYVVHRHPPVPGKELPIVIALVDLDEGVRMVGEVVGVAGTPEEARAAGESGDSGDSVDGGRPIAIGMRLQVGFRRVDDDLTLPFWRPVEQGVPA